MSSLSFWTSTMDILRFLYLVVALFVGTCLFCWLLTTHWIFGPVVTTFTFLAGLLGLGLLGVMLARPSQDEW